MNQVEKANAFAELHQKNDPVILYNIWDAGSAKAISKQGAKALATGSWSVAAAHGYKDGESIPLDFALEIVSRISQTNDLPLTVDFEGGYSDQLDGLAKNIKRLIEAGAVGLNFEDQKLGGDGLYEAAEQAERISVIRQASDEADLPLFINARTDLFLKEADTEKHNDLVEEAIERGQAYKKAGANCFFVPGLVDLDLIGKICDVVTIPVNVMVSDLTQDLYMLKSSGASRISFGPIPYLSTMAAFSDNFENLEL